MHSRERNDGSHPGRREPVPPTGGSSLGRLRSKLWYGLGLGAVALLALWLNWPRPMVRPEPQVEGRPASSARTSPEPQAAPVVEAPSGSVQRAELQAAPLADHPLTWLRVLDDASGQPVAGAHVIRLADRARLGRSSAAGLAGLPLPAGELLAVCADGYLFQQVHTTPGSSEQAPQPSRLVRDERSLRARFHFIDQGGHLLDSVRARILPEPALPGQRLPEVAEAETPTAAEQQHQRLAAQLTGLVACVRRDGKAGTALTLDGDAEVRFATAGRYRIEAASSDGHVGRCTFMILSATASVEAVPMVAGRELAGMVLDASGTNAVPGVRIRLQGGDPMDLEAVTDGLGRFALAPLAEGSYHFELEHEGRPLPVAGPYRAGDSRIRIQLPPASDR